MITSFNKLVGNQSNEQNLEGATMMDFLTSCNETALNADKTIEAACGKIMRDYWGHTKSVTKFKLRVVSAKIWRHLDLEQAINQLE